MSVDFEVFKNKYPNLFKEYPRSGFYLSAGWEDLAHQLCSILERQIVHLPEELRTHVHCAQVKEKFGGLRFYMTQETPYISGAIAMAEAMSYSVCDTCGRPGKRRDGGWIRTLCDKHNKEKNKVTQKIVQGVAAKLAKEKK